MKNFVRYLTESRAELAKVKWPTKQQAIRLTLAVVAFSAVFAAVIAMFDYIFSLILQKLILKV